MGQVINFWDISVKRLSLEEKVICLYNLAYGERGARKLIPPKSILVFVMELVKIEGNSEL